MIGEYCEGGFDGAYRIYFKDGIEIHWSHVLQMTLASGEDPFLPFDHDAINVIQAQPGRYGSIGPLRLGTLKLFPFGEAYHMTAPTCGGRGHLAFDPTRNNIVVYAPQADGEVVEIAASFRQMMLGSSFVFDG